MRLSYIVAVAVLALSTTACASLSAQTEPDSIKARNDCRLATQAVTTGHPAVKIAWALRYIRTCPSAGPALAAALVTARESRDTASLARITAPTDWMRDRAVFDAALALVQDRGASAEARVFAIRPLIWSLWPGGELNYGHLVDTDGDGVWSCGGMGPSAEGEITEGTPLAAGWVARAHAVARAIVADSTAPASVRQAAKCLALTQPDSRVSP